MLMLFAFVLGQSAFAGVMDREGPRDRSPAPSPRPDPVAEAQRQATEANQRAEEAQRAAAAAAEQARQAQLEVERAAEAARTAAETEKAARVAAERAMTEEANLRVAIETAQAPPTSDDQRKREEFMDTLINALKEAPTSGKDALKKGLEETSTNDDEDAQLEKERNTEKVCEAFDALRDAQGAAGAALEKLEQITQYAESCKARAERAREYADHLAKEAAEAARAAEQAMKDRLRHERAHPESVDHGDRNHFGETDMRGCGSDPHLGLYG